MQLKAHGLLEAGLPQPPEAPAAPRPTRLRARPAVTRDLARRRLPHAWRQLPLHGPLHCRLQPLVLALVRPPPAAAQLLGPTDASQVDFAWMPGRRPRGVAAAQSTQRVSRQALPLGCWQAAPKKRGRRDAATRHPPQPGTAGPTRRQLLLRSVSEEASAAPAGSQRPHPRAAASSRRHGESRTTSAPAGTAIPCHQHITPASTAANVCRSTHRV